MHTKFCIAANFNLSSQILADIDLETAETDLGIMDNNYNVMPPKHEPVSTDTIGICSLSSTWNVLKLVLI